MAKNDVSRASLYRHFDEDGELLYVGISNCHVLRLDQHEARSHWFWKIATITIEHFATRSAALAAEKEAISLEGPVHNGRMGRPPLHVKPVLVRLTQSALDRIERLVGPNRRSVFIREAVENELKRREAKRPDPSKDGGE